MWVSHETIYRCLYIPSRQVFDDTKFHELRTDRRIRRPRGKKRSHGRGQIRNRVSIDHRSSAAGDRSEPGHLEGDLVFGTRPSAVATLVDRQSRAVHVVALPDGYRAETVADALIAYLGRLPAHLRRSLTWDRGLEMAAHEAHHRSTRPARLLLRAASSVATRDERKYERVAAAVPAQER